MKSILILFAFFVIHITLMAQNVLVPGNNLFEKGKLRKSKTEMAYFVVSEGSRIEIGSYKVEIAFDNKIISIYSTLKFLNSPDLWTDTSISDAATFKPIYHSSFSKGNDYILKYNNGVTGYYFDKQTKKRTTIHEPEKEAFFDSYAYPYLLGLLPLSSGYKKDLIVYDYKPEHTINIQKARIEEVKSNTYRSDLTGEHKVWQVTVFDEPSNDQYEYYIDKENHHIWKMEIVSKGQNLLLIDKEVDYDPFVNKFNKEETLKLIKNGSGVISGQVFARDNQAAVKGIAILNINPKQFAKPGTSVILIPYTSFFKEWIKLNESLRKKGRAVPLPKDAAACIKVAPVYDNEGHFEFVNLMPGEYLVYTEFGYVHSGTKSEVVGYTDTYMNGMFQGSRENREYYGYSENASALVKKIVTIEKDGDKEVIKLKKTL